MNELTRMLLGLVDSTELSTDSYVRAPLSWAAGKTRSLKNILPLLPYRNGFCDVFGGSGCVLAARRKSNIEVFNDRHSGVVAFYRCLQSNEKYQQLVDRLQFTILSREEFFHFRDSWEAEQDDVERAARWWTMHQISFAKQEQHFGRVTKSTHNPGDVFSRLRGRLVDFKPMHDRLANVVVENLDYRELLVDYDAEDMVFYLDPPYIDDSKSRFKHGFTEKDHSDMLDAIFQCKGFVAVSGKDYPLYRKAPFHSIHEWETYYSTSNSSHNATELEVLYVKEAHGTQD